MPLPSQTGKDRPFMDLETNPHSLETKGAQAQQSSAALAGKTEPVDGARHATSPNYRRGAICVVNSKIRPSSSNASAASSQAQSAYRRLKERTHIAGNITNRGISSVNALGTPLGRYQKIVADSIGSRWYAFVEQKQRLGQYRDSAASICTLIEADK